MAIAKVLTWAQLKVSGRETRKAGSSEREMARNLAKEMVLAWANLKVVEKETRKARSKEQR